MNEIIYTIRGPDEDLREFVLFTDNEEIITAMRRGSWSDPTASHSKSPLLLSSGFSFSIIKIDERNSMNKSSLRTGQIVERSQQWRRVAVAVEQIRGAHICITMCDNLVTRIPKDLFDPFDLLSPGEDFVHKFC